MAFPVLAPVFAWFARKTVTRTVVGGVRSAWLWFTRTKGAQQTAAAVTLTSAFNGLVDNLSENAKSINTIISYVIVAIITLYSLPALIKYLQK